MYRLRRRGVIVPEGPEIKRLATRLSKVLTNQSLEDLRFSYRDLDRFDSELRIQKITKIDSRGKALLICFESGLTLIINFMANGLLSEKAKIPKRSGPRD